MHHIVSNTVRYGPQRSLSLKVGVKAYDSRGRVISETDAQGRTTTTSYSADDLVTTTVYADGGTRVETLYSDGSLASGAFAGSGPKTIVENRVES